VGGFPGFSRLAGRRDDTSDALHGEFYHRGSFYGLDCDQFHRDDDSLWLYVSVNLGTDRTGGTYADTYADADTHSDSHTHSDTDCDADTYSDSHAYCDADSHAYCDADTYSGPVCDAGPCAQWCGQHPAGGFAGRLWPLRTAPETLEAFADTWPKNPGLF
jgi:hypothetical protein